MADSKLSSVIPSNTIKDIYPRKPVSTLYVDNSNNTSSLEDIMYVNDIELGFPAKNFGNTSTFRFSRTYQFLSGIIVKFKITYLANATAVTHGAYLAYNLIKRLRWTAGGTELLSLGGESLVPIILDQCESFHKKCIVYEEAGVKKSDATSVALNAKTIEYSAVLPLPFSSINAKKFDNLSKPFPLHMLSEALELTIELRELTEIGSALGFSISEAYLQFQYGKVGNPEQLKKSLYKYPFSSIFSNKFAYPTGDVKKVDLNGFRRAEVNMIQIAAVANEVSRNEGLKLKNIQLTFNGQVIWRASGNDQLWDLMYNAQPCVHGYKKHGIIQTTRAGTGLEAVERYKNKLQAAATDVLVATALVEFYGHSTNAAGADGENGLFYYYNIPIGEILQKYAGHGHVLGADFTKQSIQLQFETPDNTAGILQVAYYYKGMYQFDNEQAMLVY